MEILFFLSHYYWRCNECVDVVCIYVYNLSCFVCSGDKVETFSVHKIDAKDIVDTNGAGDAFVGGNILLCTYLISFSVDLGLSCVFLGILLKIFPTALQVSSLSWSRTNLWINV